jgi:hypothetical protein
MKLLNGPFSRLDGQLAFVPAGRRRQRACRVELSCTTALTTRALARWSGRCLTALPAAWWMPSSSGPSRSMADPAMPSVSGGDLCRRRRAQVWRERWNCPTAPRWRRPCRPAACCSRFPELDLGPCRGCLGPQARWARPAGRDRVEIYRPLQVDPKVARRERFASQGARTTGLFARRAPGARRATEGARGPFRAPLAARAMMPSRRLVLRGAGGVIHDFALALGVGGGDARTRIEKWPWPFWRARSFRPLAWQPFLPRPSSWRPRPLRPAFFLSSSSLSLPLSLGALAAGLGVAVAAPLARVGGQRPAAIGRLQRRARAAAAGCLRMFLAGISGGGARSLKTLRPSLSIHCHWAAASSGRQTARKRA